MTSLFQAVGECRDSAPMDAPPGEFAASFIFPLEFCGFAGHFPGSPVLPGIAQIMAVLYACEKDAPPVLLSVTSCKFLRPVRPGERIVAGGKKTGTGKNVTVTATVRTGDGICAAMTLLTAQADMKRGLP